MLRFRLLSAAIVILTALVFVGLDSVYSPFGCQGLWLLPVGGYLILGSAIECVAMLRNTSVDSFPRMDLRWPALLGCCGVMAAGTVAVFWPLSGSPYPSDCLLGSLGWPLAAMLIAIFASFAWYLRVYEVGKGYLLRAILAGWVSCYFGGCFSFAIALRLIGDSGWGLFVLVGVIVVTKFADAGAYFSGRFLGKTKLCPQISPGKTLEGLLGGMLVAVLAAWVYFVQAGHWSYGEQIQADWLSALLLGVCLTLAGLVGDLLVSIFKRETGCKDSGNLLPGLGGLWDVSDSLLPAFVAAYLLLMAGCLSGPGQ